MKLKLFLVRSIDFYQNRVSGLKRASCVFYPTCSEYTKQALQKYGPIKGLWMGFFRILRCHPFQKNHIDPLK